MKDKLIAAGLHLGISLIVAALLLLLLFVVWFPSPLMGLGAVQGVQLILLVDLAVGPLLTFIVFKKGKPSLVFDISVICTLQIAALTYGLITIYGQTPAYLVLSYNGLHVVSRYEVENYVHKNDLYIAEELTESPIGYQGRIPVYKFVEPADQSDRYKFRTDFEFEMSLPFHMNTAAYTSFENFDYLSSAGRGALNTDSNGNECFEIPIMSGHGQVLTCLYLDGEKLRLAKVIPAEPIE